VRLLSPIQDLGCFPRFRRFGSLARLENSQLAGDLSEGQPLSNNALYRYVEPFSIRHFAIVETIRLFVQVAE
jgi:hypothetical protein